MPHTEDVATTDLGLLEAALFLSPRPLSERQIAKLLGGVSAAYVDRLLDTLAEDMAGTPRGIELRRDQGRAFLRVKAPYIDAVAHLAPHQDIPAPVLRSLAMIAYNHPMTQADLVKARGNKAYGHVQELLERRLVRAEDHGRTLLLHVTDEFLRHFGLKNVEEFRFHVGEVGQADETHQDEDDRATASDAAERDPGAPEPAESSEENDPSASRSSDEHEEEPATGPSRPETRDA